jgi:hypothetical protein
MMTNKEETNVDKNEAIDIEIDQLKKNTDKVSRVLNNILRLKQSNVNRIANILFIILLVFLFIARFVFYWIDNMLSLELGVILISIKIIWLIRIQSEYNHYIFVIMDSINKKQKDILDQIIDMKNSKSK